MNTTELVKTITDLPPEDMGAMEEIYNEILLMCAILEEINTETT